MQRYGDASIPLRHANMRTGLPDVRKAESLQRFDGLASRDIPGATSGLNEDRIADEMDTDSMKSGAFVEMYRYRLRDLLLQIAQVLPLRCDATGPIGIIPRCHQPARLLVA